MDQFRQKKMSKVGLKKSSSQTTQNSTLSHSNKENTFIKFKPIKTPENNEKFGLPKAIPSRKSGSSTTATRPALAMKSPEGSWKSDKIFGGLNMAVNELNSSTIKRPSMLPSQKRFNNGLSAIEFSKYAKKNKNRRLSGNIMKKEIKEESFEFNEEEQIRATPHFNANGKENPVSGIESQELNCDFNPQMTMNEELMKNTYRMKSSTIHHSNTKSFMKITNYPNSVKVSSYKRPHIPKSSRYQYHKVKKNKTNFEKFSNRKNITNPALKSRKGSPVKAEVDLIKTVNELEKTLETFKNPNHTSQKTFVKFENPPSIEYPDQVEIDQHTLGVKKFSQIPPRKMKSQVTLHSRGASMPETRGPSKFYPKVSKRYEDVRLSEECISETSGNITLTQKETLDVDES